MRGEQAIHLLDLGPERRAMQARIPEPHDQIGGAGADHRAGAELAALPVEAARLQQVGRPGFVAARRLQRQALQQSGVQVRSKSSSVPSLSKSMARMLAVQAIPAGSRCYAGWFQLTSLAELRQ
jgi:hypothetical protein